MMRSRLVEVLSLLFPLHPATDPQRFSARSCSTCSYFMQGVKFGEPDTCNAFHMPTQNTCIANNCPDWELKWKDEL